MNAMLKWESKEGFQVLLIATNGEEKRNCKTVDYYTKEKKVEEAPPATDENKDAKFAPFYNNNDDQNDDYTPNLDSASQKINNEYVYNAR